MSMVWLVVWLAVWLVAIPKVCASVFPPLFPRDLPPLSRALFLSTQLELLPLQLLIGFEFRERTRVVVVVWFAVGRLVNNVGRRMNSEQQSCAQVLPTIIWLGRLSVLLRPQTTLARPI
jgi:hypothetical protein